MTLYTVDVKILKRGSRRGTKGWIWGLTSILSKSPTFKSNETQIMVQETSPYRAKQVAARHYRVTQGAELPLGNKRFQLPCGKWVRNGAGKYVLPHGHKVSMLVSAVYPTDQKGVVYSRDFRCYYHTWK